MKSFGDRIAQRLAELGKSQRWLADAVGIKQPSVHAIINNPDSGSKHAVSLAEALGVLPKWLVDGTGPKTAPRKQEALLVGKVGAGAEITRFDEGTVLEGIEPPPGLGICNAAIISGDSQYPLQEGWLIFYGPEHAGIPEDCIGKLSVVQVKDGPILLKTVKRARKKGLFRLESWNAPPPRRRDGRMGRQGAGYPAALNTLRPSIQRSERRSASPARAKRAGGGGVRSTQPACGRRVRRGVHQCACGSRSPTVIANAIASIATGQVKKAERAQLGL